MMKIVFMGTPDFAVPSLQALHEAGHEIELVVTQPDAQRDRGKKRKPTPVKERALELELDVAQPDRIKNNAEFTEQLRALAPDVIVVVAYGKILPPEILEIPAKGCINVHGSLLPRFRGAAPIQRAILEGDDITGVTIMYMEEGLDTGDMLAKVTTPIEDKNAGDLHDELSELGAKLLVETLAEVEADRIDPQPQDDALATYAPMIFKKDGLIDFTCSPEEVERQIRAMTPWPGAYTKYNDKTFKIWKAIAAGGTTPETAGTVLSVSSDGIDISCGGSVLKALEIQLPGKKRMAVSDYLRGNKIETGCVLG